MSSLILPPGVWQSKLIEEQARRVDQHLESVGVFEQHLRELDGRLELHLASETAGYPFVAGCWAVVRRNDGAPDSVFPIVSAGGGFREPGSADLEALRGMDLHRPGVFAALVQQDELAARRLEKQKRDQQEARTDELYLRVKADLNPGVGMSAGWTRSKRARRPK